MVASRQSKLNQVQVLRGIAAFSILFAHTPYIQKGHFGVDLFFIISGFIMMYVTEKGYSGFLYKRIIRIVPLYYLATFGLFLLAGLIPQYINTATTDVTHLLKSLLFFPYFNGRTVEPIVRLGWTLNYEMFFYLVFYISLNISVKYRAVLTSSALMVLVTAPLYINSSNVVFKFYTNSILIEFIYGMLLYYIFQHFTVKGETLSKQVSFTLYLLGIGAFASLFFLPEFDTSNYRYLYWGLPSIVIFCLVVIGGKNVRSPSFLVLLGNISYSLYLLHPYILIFVGRIIYPLDTPNISTYLITGVSYLLCVFVAYLSWKLIEVPCQRYATNK